MYQTNSQTKFRQRASSRTGGRDEGRMRKSGRRKSDGEMLEREKEGGEREGRELVRNHRSSRTGSMFIQGVASSIRPHPLLPPSLPANTFRILTNILSFFFLLSKHREEKEKGEEKTKDRERERENQVIQFESARKECDCIVPSCFFSLRSKNRRRKKGEPISVSNSKRKSE